MDTWTRDLRYAIRSLARSPLFSGVAIVTLALGIGVNATIFTFVNAVLLAPPPIERPEEVVALFSSWEAEDWGTTSYLDFLDLQRQADVFSGLCGTSMALSGIQHDGISELTVGELVTGEYFDVLGVELARGRGLTRADNAPGAPRSVVLSHGLWQRRFGGRQDIVGSSARFSGELYEVVGVAAAKFTGLMPGLASEFWVPASRMGEIEPGGQINSVSGDPGATRLERRGYRWLWLRGRLAEGIEPAAAEAQVATIMASLASEYPLTNEGVTARAQTIEDIRLHPDIDGPLRAAALVMMGAVGLVLLVVCANLANILLARAQGRRREIAIRLALGAPRGRLVRQLITESLVLSMAGGLLAMLLATWTTKLLLKFQPPLPFAIQLDIAVDARVTFFTSLLALGSALAFALVPALQSTRPDLVPALKQAIGSTDGGPRLLSLRNVLAVAQVAISTVLLIGAALLMRAVGTAQEIELGFDAQKVASLSLPLELQGYEEAAGIAFLDTLRLRASELPGVESATLTSRVPLDINFNLRQIFPASLGLGAEDSGFEIDVGWYGPEFFTTVGTPLLAGRSFTTADHPETPTVAIVNQAMAERFWTVQTAIGQRFRTGRYDGHEVEIVGVAANSKVRTVGEAARPLIHFARPQRPSATAALLVRSVGPDATPLLAELRRLALDLDPQVAIAEAGTLASKANVSLFPVRMGASLLGLFAVLALVLASVGLYGVIAMAVTRRYREIGVRVALGARPHEVATQVARQGMVLVAAGSLLGTLTAAVLSQHLRGVLYGTAALDPLAFGGALAILGGVALLANAGPALRAANLDVVTALDSD